MDPSETPYSKFISSMESIDDQGLLSFGTPVSKQKSKVYVLAVSPRPGLIISRDSSTGKSLYYGYVNFASQQEAIHAIELKNHAILNGKAIRMTWSRRDPDARKNTSGNVFVKDNAGLEELFTRFGIFCPTKLLCLRMGRAKDMALFNLSQRKLQMLPLRS
ncbi:hypothetical protein RIF29_15394 [Crotalaria pallida]|uniref:RRM domain-containing protein n=1 Tax=Crotalaria pallida TaxID=3830 RepID=A0AAN9FFI4_CROPI